MITLPYPLPAAILVGLLLAAFQIVTKSDPKSRWFRIMAGTEIVGCLIGIGAYLATHRTESLGLGLFVVAAGVIPFAVALVRRESLVLHLW